MTLKRTPLFPLYARYGAKTVEFGGWEMPVQFTSILQEHEAVRTRAGLFDVSHMGEVEVCGSDAAAFLQRLVTNDVSRLAPGMAMYSPVCYPHGGCVDDVLVYCLAPDRYGVVVNAANTEKDLAWFREQAAGFSVTLTDRSDEVALLALQGPQAESILQPLTQADLSQMRYYRFTQADVAGVSALISRTGYTGEDGFELYVPAASAQTLWEALVQAGEPHGMALCGLGARDTLRLEARLPLYGHELSESITPLEAGLGTFVKLDKGDFIGREALARQKQEGVTRKIVGIELVDRGIPRAEQPVLADGQVIGHVTSGTMSPTLKLPIGLALVDVRYAEIGRMLQVDVRGKLLAAKVVKTPFYKTAR
ncbi:MAG: glycine cleavage system aminomethyltransferase GcvT [Thermoflavifilum sp.]|nr:glycine cleavage system aminomethyltransferase GcvT [Thermoflavifilum sp.]MCL6514953.1 glycine cleavage system aminomethyltransferase GcvT [Alicyclobacillus sp.]